LSFTRRTFLAILGGLAAAPFVRAGVEPVSAFKPSPADSLIKAIFAPAVIVAVSNPGGREHEWIRNAFFQRGNQWRFSEHTPHSPTSWRGRPVSWK
jgi:hypothetical protein